MGGRLGNSDEGEYQRQHHKDDGHPLGVPGQLGVPASGLVLREKGVGGARDSAVHAGGLALLEQHHGNEENSQQNLNYA